MPFDAQSKDSEHTEHPGRDPATNGTALYRSNSLDGTSPLTPSYLFGYDDHFHTHHKTDRIPNLHDHSHVHCHSHTGHSHNMRGVFLHVMAVRHFMFSPSCLEILSQDTLGSVGVIISTLLIQLFGWTGFDPIASLFIAILIAVSVVPLVLDTGRILALDVGDRDKDIRQALTEVRRIILSLWQLTLFYHQLASIEGLSSQSDIRFWPKDSSSLIGSIRIHLVPPNLGSTASSFEEARQWWKVDRIVHSVDALLRERIPGLEELTIQAEMELYPLGS